MCVRPGVLIVVPGRCQTRNSDLRAGLISMQQQDTTHLLDGAGVALRGVPCVDDQLGFHAVSMRARVRDHPVVPLLDRTLVFDGQRNRRWQP